MQSFVQASNAALEEALSQDERVLLLGEDIGDRQGGGVAKVTAGLSTKFGEDRVLTTPISEQAIMGAAIGAALAGMLPVAEIMMMNFITVAMDQLFDHAAKLRFMSGGRTPVPITVRTDTGGGFGFGAQHSDMLEAWLAHSPGLKVVMPSTGEHVAAGTPIYILETDKVENEMEAVAGGTITLLATAGETYPVGAVLAEIG